MPRPRTYSRSQVIRSAMERFWYFGFEATSMDDLVRATGVSRHGLYVEFEGKEALFEACLEAYSEAVVTPAFQQVEASGATLDDVEAYFLQQIALADSVGLPGPGCLMANTMTEVAPHKAQALTIVSHHNERLRSGFENAVRGSGRLSVKPVSRGTIRDCANLLVIFANGLWSVSRTIDDARVLRRSARAFVETIQSRIAA
ncbi:MAG: helix-turn-helix domain-containing protein [Pseudomonadota bacterium]